MKTLICQQPGLFKYQDTPASVLQPKGAIIKVHRVGICGTDLHAFTGTQPFFQYPRILGHEISGELIDIDPEYASRITSKYVTVIPYFHCGHCIACRRTHTNCCANLEVAGVHRDGALSEFFSVPAELVVDGAGLDLDMLALVEPLSIGCHAVQRARIEPGEFMLVIGAGPIGLAVAQFGILAGANVIIADVNASRIEIAKTILPVYGIKVTETIIPEVLKITARDFPTAVFDATGNRNAINSGLKFLAHSGRYVLVGLQKGDLVFSHPDFHKRETMMMSSRNALRSDFETVISAISNNSIDPRPFITHHLPFEEVASRFQELADPRSGVIKALIEL